MTDVKYYDIGLNLFCRQFTHPDRILRGAADAGVFCILTGSDMKENRLVDAYVRGHEAYGTAGIHPHNADAAKLEDFAEIERIVTGNPRIVAVGECGLDFDRMFSTRENQIRCLERHIELAGRLKKPLFLHERAAAETFAAQFRGYPEICRRSVVHCFTGDRKTLEMYLSMGFSIGITGWICDDRRADELRDAVRILPSDRVLIETDAPYLTPRNVPGRGRTNVPQNIVYVARELAGYMNVEEDELIRCARENTERLFGIHPDKSDGCDY
ncbi:MAG: TatD family hydrolase [Clostridiales bacterium]|nr:TatD family hydrolase [Clostridiales bacterium]